MTLKSRKFYYSKELEKLEVLATKDSLSFVHFLGKDKRLDKWISTSSLGPQIPPEELSPTKIQPSYEEEADVPLVRNIESIYIHNYKIDCWYYSPYPFPDEFGMELWICWRCLRYHPVEGQLGKHLKTCKKTTPGEIVYKKDGLKVFLIDGQVDKMYCQCLSLLGKLFIDHKTIMYDLDPFVFYVLVDEDDQVTGFFSKEKSSPEHYNLSCILVLPQYQRKGYGRILMELSYEIYKKNGLVGGPERPLSDLGLLSYLKYWTNVLICLLVENPGVKLQLQEIAILTGIRIDDILLTLNSLGLLTYWKDDVLCIPHSIVEEIRNREKMVFKRFVQPNHFVKDVQLV